MSYWSQKELNIFKEITHYEHKKVKVRKVQHCYNSGDSIYPGQPAEMAKVYPGSFEGYKLQLKSPSNFYKCGKCMECTH